MSLCFLLTAGLGTRLRPFTNTLPKPCLPFLNLPLMDYSFYLAKQAGFNNFLANIHFRPEQVTKHIHQLEKHCHHFGISDETDKILGSGGALWKAKETLSQYDYFLVGNGDEVLVPSQDRTLAELVEQFHLDQGLCTLLTCDHPDLLTKLKAVWVDPNNNVQGFGLESPHSKSKPVHYTGYKVFSRRIFDYLTPGESNIFYDILVGAIQKGERVTVHHLSNAHWYETGDISSFVTASQSVASQHFDYLKKAQQFFNLDPQRKFNSVQEPLIYEKSSIVPETLTWEGVAAVGRHVQIGKNVKLKNSFCLDHTNLEEDCAYENKFIFP